MRYQQGIGTPETLGVQPTMWKEPQMFTPKGFSMPSINAGTSRNYGSTPKYVDTLGSRWGRPMFTGSLRTNQSPLTLLRRRSRSGAGNSPITTPSTSRAMTRSASGVVDPAERRGLW